MKRLRVSEDLETSRTKKKIKNDIEMTVDGTPIFNVHDQELPDGRDKFRFCKLLRIPSLKQFFEVDMLKIQITPKTLVIPNFKFNIFLDDKAITDTFYFANGKILKTAHGPNEKGIFISKEEILVNNTLNHRQNWINIFFLKQEFSSLVTLGDGWYDQSLSMEDMLRGYSNNPNFPYAEMIMQVSFYSNDELKDDVEKFMLILELFGSDLTKYLMSNYLIPFIESNCGYGVRRKEDCVNFDKTGGTGTNYVVGGRWDGQPRGFQEMYNSYLWHRLAGTNDMIFL